MHQLITEMFHIINIIRLMTSFDECIPIDLLYIWRNEFVPRFHVLVQVFSVGNIACHSFMQQNDISRKSVNGGKPVLTTRGNSLGFASVLKRKQIKIIVRITAEMKMETVTYLDTMLFLKIMMTVTWTNEAIGMEWSMLYTMIVPIKYGFELIDIIRGRNVGGRNKEISNNTHRNIGFICFFACRFFYERGVIQNEMSVHCNFIIIIFYCFILS